MNDKFTYTLLQNSDGETFRGKPLKFKDVADALFRPDRTNCWFAAGVDWNMLFSTESYDTRVRLFREQEDVLLDDYTVSIFPRKILRIVGHGHNSVSHYDTFGFFQTSFLKSLEQWKIPIPEIISEGKKARLRGFEDWNESKIEEYNLTETKLHVQMMDKLQQALERVGYGDLSGYHGAGSIASRMLDKLNARAYMKIPPEDVKRNYMLDGYYGGRIELLKRGEISPVYNYDINSAYPSATRELPDLATAKWIQVKGDDALNYDFGIVNVEWNEEDCEVMGPFPFRMDGKSHGLIGKLDNEDLVRFPLSYSTRGHGKYHLIEVKTAVQKGLWNITVGSGWALENGYERPFYEPITKMMHERLRLKKAKDFGNIPLKLGANSFYGKMAQLNKGNRAKKGVFTQYNNMLWAGYITSWTRSQLIKYVKPNAAILLCTDGIYSTEPITCPIGENLGEWESETFKTGRFILPGIYGLFSDSWKWKTRGYPKSQGEDFYDWIFSQVIRGKIPKIEDELFIGVKRSLALHKKYPRPGFHKVIKRVDWGEEVSSKRIWFSNEDSIPRDYSNQRSSKPFDLHLNGSKEVQAQLDKWEIETNYEA